MATSEAVTSTTRDARDGRQAVRPAGWRSPLWPCVGGIPARVHASDGGHVHTSGRRWFEPLILGSSEELPANPIRRWIPV
jgi:hypothetical protein